MIATFFPLKKLRRNSRFLLFLAILLAGLAAVYHEMVASKAWSSDTSKFSLNKCLLTSTFFKSCITWSGKLWCTVCANGAARHKQHLSLVWLQRRKTIKNHPVVTAGLKYLILLRKQLKDFIRCLK